MPRHADIFCVTFVLILATACATAPAPTLTAGEEVCSAWTDILGENHQCSNAEGGALDRDLVHREVTQRIVTEAFPLAHQEWAQAALVFHPDGSYEARKLRFTGYSAESQRGRVFLVYAEDSKGRYEINENGTIALNEPDFSTCSERTGQGSDTIYPHIQTFRRKQPFRTIQNVETGIVFAAKGWLGAFTGEDYWSGRVESRGDVMLPPFPESTGRALRYEFDGSLADIHYGCLNEGFDSFTSEGAEKFTTLDEYRYDDLVDPKKLHKGTRLIISP